MCFHLQVGSLLKQNNGFVEKAAAQLVSVSASKPEE